MKRIAAILTILALTFAFAPASFAGHGDHDCGKGQCSMKSGCDEGGMCPIQGKILKKAKFFLENKDAIGLNAEQVAQIEAIKMDTKKAMIRGGAEMEIMMLEMKAKLHEEKVDVEGMNAMIDKGSAGWAEAGKASVAAYAKLKGILTADQMTKAKEVWKKKS